MANGACLEISRCPERDREAWLAQDTRKSYVSPQDAYRFRDLLLEEGEVKGFEAALRRWDGSVAWLSNTARLVRDEEGRPVAIGGSFVDVTERKRAVEALQESEARFRFISENTSDGIVVIENDVIVYVSPAYLEILGYPESSEIGRDRGAILELIHPDDRDEVLKTVYGAIAEGLPHAIYSYRARAADGRYVWREDHARFIYGPDGGYEKAIVVCRDITARKEAERRISALASVVESSDDIIVVKDLDLRVVATNNAFARASGHASVEEMIGRTDAELFGVTPDTEPVKSYMEDERRAQRLPKGEHLLREEPVVYPDGEIRMVLTKKYPIYDKTGRLIGTGNISPDITERKRAEDALKESEERLRSTLASMDDLMFVLDRDGIFVEYHQPPNAEALYAPPLEFLGKSYAEVLPPEVAGHMGKAIEAVRRTGEVQQVDYSLDLSRGRRWFHAKLSARGDKQGAFADITVVARDVTERKRMEEERLSLQRRRLTEKAESLSRMAGAVAHHFNNMLSVVLGNLELAEMDAPQWGRAAENLAEARKAAKRAAEISGVMLTYLGHTRMRREPLDLSALCRAGLEGIRAALPENVRLEDDLPLPGPVVEADSDQIRRLLSALVVNAGEAMKGSPGRVRVSVSTVSAKEIPEDHRFPVGGEVSLESHACLAVHDFGCGMGAETIEKVFDPFYTDKFTGRGLGLPIGLGIVKVHGGLVSVESEPGRGSVFRVFLPLSSNAVVKPSEEAS